MIRLHVDVPKGWTVVLDKSELRALMRAVGNEVAARARSLIRQGSKGKNRRQSAAGTPPVSRTGTLAGSIRVRMSRDGLSAHVADQAKSKGDAFYALFLEAGAHGGGGNTSNKANILPAGGIYGRNRVRGANRMKASAISRTRVMLPHPFLTRALDDVANASLNERVKRAVLSGMKFERATKY
jgi:hypothetical protein